MNGRPHRVLNRIQQVYQLPSVSLFAFILQSCQVNLAPNITFHVSASCPRTTTNSKVIDLKMGS